MNTALLGGFGVAIVLLLIGSILISAIHRSRTAAARRRRAAAASPPPEETTPVRAELPIPPPPAQPPPPFSHQALPFPASAAWPRAFHAAHGPGARAAYPVVAVYRTQPGPPGQGMAFQAAIFAPYMARPPEPVNVPPPFNPNDLAMFKVGPEHRETQCGICLEPFLHDDVSAGQCFHKFHSSCIKSWLAKDAARSCPVCRNSFLDTPGLDGIVGQDGVADSVSALPPPPPPPQMAPSADAVTPARAPT